MCCNIERKDRIEIIIDMMKKDDEIMEKIIE
jgi:hypothetical protein